MNAGTLSTSNYSLTGSGKGTFSTNPDTVAQDSASVYTLTWASGEMVDGGNVTITVTSVYDEAGNLLGPPTSGTDTGGAVGVLPEVDSIAVINDHIIDLAFSEEMNDTGLLTTTNYTASGTGLGTLGVHPDSVENTAGNTFRLTWNEGEMRGNQTVTVTVAEDLEDLLGNAMGATDSGSDDSVAVQPTVDSVAVVDGRHIDVTFSEAMHATGITTAANYTLSGAGKGSLDANPNSVELVEESVATYRLSWTIGEMVVGGDITVTVAGVTDLAQNANDAAHDDGTDAEGGVGADPGVASVTVSGARMVDLTFSEAMGDGVTTAANYTLSGTGQGTLADNPDSVASQGGNVYRLTWNAGEMLAGGDVTIVVANIEDSAGNAIDQDANSATDEGGAVATSPTVNSVAVVDGSNIDVTFSEAMNAAGITTAVNYALSGGGQGSLTVHPNSVASQGGNVYRLTWNSGEMVGGGDITVTVAAVTDAAGNAIGDPAAGTDSEAGVGTAPSVISVAVSGLRTVDVTFDEAMGASSTTAGSYALSGSGQGTLTANPSSVAAQGGNAYRLTWNEGEMFVGGDITIAVADAADSAGNIVDSDNDTATDDNSGLGTQPQVSSVAVVDGRHIDVTFSEPMHATGVTTAASYTLSGAGKGTLADSPDSVTLVEKTDATYRLTWTSGEMIIGGDITVTVAAVTDLAQNPIDAAADEGTDAEGGVGAEPSVEVVVVSGARTVDVSFSEAMGDGVTTAANYTLTGEGQGTLTANPDSVASQGGNVYRLTWNAGEMFIDGDVTITVADVEDAVGNAIDDDADNGTDEGGGVGTSPTVDSVAVVDGTHVDVTFDETMSAGGITTAANYTLSGTGQGSLADHPSSVASEGGNVYRLTWAAGEMVDGGDITVTVSGVTDTAGNTIGDPAAETDSAAGIGTSPTVVSVAVSGLRTVDVSFDEGMGSSATTVDNYALSGSGQGTLLENPDSVSSQGDNVYRLTWDDGEMFIGGDITIAVSNATDTAGNIIDADHDTATDDESGLGAEPQVSGVNVIDTATVDVTFTEAIAGAGATTVGNYTASGTGLGTLASHPDDVEFQGGSTYRLTWQEGEMFIDGDLTIGVASVTDLALNPLDTDNDEATAESDEGGIAPLVESVTVVDTRTVTIVFSEAMSAGSATIAGNYTLSGTGQGSLAHGPDEVFQSSATTFELSWDAGEMLIGGDITITAAGVTDLALNSIDPKGTTATDAEAGVGVEPTVDSVVVVDGSTVDVSFSEDMGEDGITTATNYLISGPGAGTLAENPDGVAFSEGTTYRLTWSDGEMFIGGDVSIVVDGVTDEAGNSIDAEDNSGTDDEAGIGVEPTVHSVTVVDGRTIDVSFDEAMDGETAAEVANYALSGTGQGTLDHHPATVELVEKTVATYRLTWEDGEMFIGGDITIAVASATDLAGNAVDAEADSGSDDESGVGEAPTVDSVVVIDGSTVDVAFTEAVDEEAASAANYVLSGTGQGTLDNHPATVELIEKTVATYRLTWEEGEMFDGGDVTVTVAEVADLAGNAIGDPDDGTDTEDAVGVAPSLTLESDSADDVNGAFIVTVTADEDVDSFNPDQIAVTNGDASDFESEGSVLTFTVTPDEDGEVTVHALSGAAMDLAGNASDESDVLLRTYDATAPEVAAITPITNSPTTGTRVRFSVEFSESVTDFDDADDVTVSVDGLAFGDVEIAAESETEYTVEVQSISGTGTISISVAAAAAHDSAGNSNEAFGPSDDVTRRPPSSGGGGDEDPVEPPVDEPPVDDGEDDPVVIDDQGGVEINDGSVTADLSGFTPGDNVALDASDDGNEVTLTIGDSAAPQFGASIEGFGSGGNLAVSQSDTGDLISVAATTSDGQVINVDIANAPAGAQLTLQIGDDGSVTIEVTTEEGDAASFVGLAVDEANSGARFTFAFGDARVGADPQGAAVPQLVGDAVTISVTGLAVDSVVSLSLGYPSELGRIDAADLRLLRQDPATGDFEPAGDEDRGASAATAVPRDYGVDLAARTVWAETGELGTFAAGVPADLTLGSGVDDGPSNGPRICGLGAVQSIALTMCGLALMQRRQRRHTL